MNQLKNLQKLRNLSYFDKNSLAQYIELKDNSLYADINRWLKNGILIQLKKGLYVTREYAITQPDKDTYREFIANKLREPSYLSLEYVLQKYSILSEAVYGLTSITTKSRRTYTNSFGSFIYRNLKSSLFTGYQIKTQGQFTIKEATKAKALFDYLYLKLYRVASFDQPWLQSLRLNLEEFTEKDWQELATYCQLAGPKKFQSLPNFLKKAYQK